MSLPSANIKKRTVVVFSIAFAALFALILRVAYWQMYRGSEMRAAAERQQTSRSEIIASRGSIYDRNGKALAESATVNTLVCNPQDVNKKDEGETESKYPPMVAEKLSVILNMDYEKIMELLTKNNRYQVIKKRLTVDEAEQIKKIKSSAAEEDKELKKAFKGVYFEEDTKRYYSYNVAPHLIGFTGYDNTGLLGIELTFEKELSGNAGVVKNSQNAAVRVSDEI